MNCWDVLGISPNLDIDEIRKAFATQSRKHHPEDDPEGFKMLRDAYNQAVKIAKLQESQYQSLPFGTASDEHNELSKLNNYACRDTVSDSLNFGHTIYPKASDDTAEAGGDFNFSSSEDIKIRDDYYTHNAFAMQIKGFAKKEKHRQKMRKMKRIFINPHFMRLILSVLALAALFIIVIIARNNGFFDSDDSDYHSFIIPTDVLRYDQIDELKSQATDIINKEDNVREDVLESIESGMPFKQNSYAQLLHIAEQDYENLLDNYRNLGGETVAGELETYRPQEEDFVLKRILPLIKQGIVEEHSLPTVFGVSSMVGISYADYITLFAQYKKDYDELKLDLVLLQHIHLVSHDQWDFSGIPSSK